MINQLISNKYYVVGLLVVLFSSGWFFGWKKTIELKSEVSDLERSIQDEQALQIELVRLNSILGEQSYSDRRSVSEYQELILDDLNLFMKDKAVDLHQVLPTHNYEEGAYEVQTWVITVEGSFHDLLQLEHHYESNDQGYKLLSVQFKREKNQQTRRDRLVASFYLQNVTNNA